MATNICTFQKFLGHRRHSDKPVSWKIKVLWDISDETGELASITRKDNPLEMAKSDFENKSTNTNC